LLLVAVHVLIQSGSDMLPRDENGDLIYEEQTSISETWQVRKQQCICASFLLNLFEFDY